MAAAPADWQVPALINNTGSALPTGHAASADATTIPTSSRRRGISRGFKGFFGTSSGRGSGRVRGRGGRVIVSLPSTPTPIPQASDTEDKKAVDTIAPAITRARSTSLKVRFPLLSTFHGKELVTVTVGDGKDQADFVVHKTLLCAASSYFSAALEGQFAESTAQTLTLKQHNPQAFEVLYQYIYTGVVRPATFYFPRDTLIGQDVLWLRVFRLADATMFHDLALIAYRRLRGLFSAAIPRTPTQTFIVELFDGEYPQTRLQEYVVAHSAFWINKGDIIASEPWVTLMEKSTTFGADIAMQLMKLSSTSYFRSRDHPSEDKSFDLETLYPTIELRNEPEDREICLFEAICSSTRKMNWNVTDDNDFPMEGAGTIRLLKDVGSRMCSIELSLEHDRNHVLQLESLFEIESHHNLGGLAGRVQWLLYDHDEHRAEGWRVAVSTKRLADELASLMNNNLVTDRGVRLRRSRCSVVGMQ